MSRIRALIVDDEPLARRGIRQLLAAFPDVDVAAECGNGGDAVRALAAECPDLVFLDVEMPGLGGLDVINVHGADRMPLMVFITAHQEYAVRAFDTQAVDYLVKPLSEARFSAMMRRVYRRLRDQGQGPRLEVAGAAGPIWLDAGEIDWIEASGDHAVIHASGARHRVRAPLANLEARLDPGRFARVHRSALVRLDQVRGLHRALSGETVLVLRDGTVLPLSRRRAAKIRGLLSPTHRSPANSDRSARER
ncbi:MAG: LytR/AlgR family response regulator transcription factor [Gemmatimonadales bacterium]